MKIDVILTSNLSYFFCGSIALKRYNNAENPLTIELDNLSKQEAVGLVRSVKTGVISVISGKEHYDVLAYSLKKKPKEEEKKDEKEKEVQVEESKDEPIEERVETTASGSTEEETGREETEVKEEETKEVVKAVPKTATKAAPRATTTRKRATTAK